MGTRMNTILFSLCWLGEPWRVSRYEKWIKFQLSIQKELGFDRIILVDNASDVELLKTLKGNIYSADNGNVIHLEPNSIIDIYRYEEHIPRTGIWEYPYCWRGVEWLQNFIKNSNPSKIIALDSDFYILTSKLADYVRDLDSGWISFHCKKYGFPEAAMHILCRDSVDRLLNLPIPSYTYYNNQHMEHLLNFTHVWKDTFIGDRHGETLEKQKPEWDWYGQWTDGCPDMVFNLKGNNNEIQTNS